MKQHNVTMIEEENTPLREQFLAAEKAVNKVCVKQADMVRAMLLAILSREHCILVGPHGCNKTRAINSLLTALNACHNGDTFFATLDKSTPPEVLLGMPSVKALQTEDRWRRNMKGKLPEAKFAFIGEVFRASAMTRASLHTVINERYVENDGQRVDCPLHTLFADSNSYPVREEDLPFYDRLLIRYNVGYIPGVDRDAFLEMLLADERPPVNALVDRDGIDRAYAEAQKVSFPPQIGAALQEIRTQLLQKEITLSNRRWARSKNILRASAWLRGGSSVDTQDLTVLRYVLWNTPEQYDMVTEVLAGFTVNNSVVSEEDLLLDAERIFNAGMNSSEYEIGEAIISLAEVAEKLVTDEGKQKIAKWTNDLSKRLIEA